MKRYQTAVPISTGATANVYRAFDPVLGRDVALKFLHRRDPETLKRLQREVRALARIAHPAICRVYDMGEQDGQPYIAMQLAEGEELTTAAQALTLEDKVDVMRRIADGVQAIHDEALIHRDLKPANIMITRGADGHPHPVVVDFGLVQDASQDGLTRDGQLMGTPPYMAPEQIVGDPTDHRIDIYALGATFYEMLTGEPPLHGDRSVEILWKAVHEDSPSVRQSDPSIPRDLEVIVQKCLAKEPAQRYASAGALAQDLDRFAAGKSIVARPEGLGSRARRKMRQHRWRVGLATLALSIAIVSAWWVDRNTTRTAQQLAAAERWSSLARDADAQIRAAYMREPHDLRPDRARLAERVAEFEEALEDAGALDQGPLHYAIGAHYLALERIDEAVDHLQRANDLGYETPEAGYTLGLALGQHYDRRLEEAGYLPNGTEREKARRDLEAAYRPKITAYLARGRDIASFPRAYVEGLIALYERRFSEASTAAANALKNTPWLYEAKLLAGDTALRQGIEATTARDFESAAAFFQDADTAYRAVHQTAPSDPRPYRGLCEIGIYRLGAASDQPDLVGSIEALKDAAVTDCTDALFVDPERLDTLLRLSSIWAVWAQYQMWERQPSENALAYARQYAARAAELHPDSSRSFIALGVADVLTAEAASASGQGEMSAPAEAAIAHLERALELQPNQTPALRVLGTALRLRAMGERRDGGPSERVWLERGVEHFTVLAKLHPDRYEFHYELGIAARQLAEVRFQEGLEVRAPLERAVHHLQLALEIDPKSDWAWTELATAQSHLADVLALTETPTETLRTTREDSLLAAQRAVDLQPDIFEFHSRKILVLLAGASHQLVRDRDPSTVLDEARIEVDALQQLDPEHTVPARLQADIELLAARWALHRGQSPAPHLEAAERALDGHLSSGDRRTQIDLLIWKGWAAIEAGQRGDEVRMLASPGLELIVNRPDLPPLELSQRGALKLLLAASSETPTSTLADARRDLEAALTANPWLRPRILFFLDLVRTLEQGEAPTLAGRPVMPLQPSAEPVLG